MHGKCAENNRASKSDADKRN